MKDKYYLLNIFWGIDQYSSVKQYIFEQTENVGNF